MMPDEPGGTTTLLLMILGFLFFFFPLPFPRFFSAPLFISLESGVCSGRAQRKPLVAVSSKSRGCDEAAF